MLIDAVEHLDGLPARLSLLASNQHLQADKSLSSRVATAYDSPDLVVQQAGNIVTKGKLPSCWEAVLSCRGGRCAAGVAKTQQSACLPPVAAEHLWLRLTLSGLSRSAMAVPSARNSGLLRISK